MCYQMHSSVTFLSPNKHSSCCLSSLLCWDYVRKLYLEGDFTSAKWVCISCAAFFLTGKILLLCPFPLKHCFPVEILVDCHQSISSEVQEQSWWGTDPKMLLQEPHTVTNILELSVLAGCVLWCSPPSLSSK